MNLGISQQQSRMQFALRAMTLIQDVHSVLSPDQSVCSTCAQLLHGCTAAYVNVSPLSGIRIVLLGIKGGTRSVSQWPSTRVHRGHGACCRAALMTDCSTCSTIIHCTQRRALNRNWKTSRPQSKTRPRSRRFKRCSQL